MRYEKILQKDKYALVLREESLDEYAVVYGLNEEDGEWQHTVDYWNFGKYSSTSKAKALQEALECFRCKTEERYISRSRLEELATKLIDALLEYDEEFARECFAVECEMEDHEMDFFEIKTESEDE